MFGVILRSQKCKKKKAKKKKKKHFITEEESGRDRDEGDIKYN